MLEDIVVDTNVLVHSQNPGEDRCPSARALLKALLGVQTSICVDEGFALVESHNRSFIGREYLDNLRFGSLALAVVTTLARRKQVKQLPKRPNSATTRRINQLIRKPVDRVFLGVAVNSEEKVLVSHDYVDFQASKRETIRRELEVYVIEAQECLPAITPM